MDVNTYKSLVDSQVTNKTAPGSIDHVDVGGLLKSGVDTAIDRSNQTGTQAISTVTNLQTSLDSKVSTVTTITINGETHDLSTDRTFTVSIDGGDAATLNGQLPSYYLSRTNHTGSQAISTITNLQTSLDAKEDITNKVTSLTSPNNITYPSSQAVSTALSLKADTSSLAAIATTGDFSDLVNTPTTLSGYGITDGVSTARTLTINGSTQDLSANRSWTLSTTDIGEGTNLYFTNSRARSAISLTTTGTAGSATYNSTTGVLNIPIYSGGGGSVAWGAITGTLSDQTDLQTALDAKVDANIPITGSTHTKITYDSKGLVTSATDATTTDISEGTNLYYTDSRFDTRLGTKTTDDLSEGVTNLYYTDSRSRASVSLTTTGSSGASTYNNTTGALNIPNYTLSGLGGVSSSRTITINTVTQDLSADRSWTLTTDDVSEGITNKYYSTTLFNADLATKSTSDITEGTNLYYTDARSRASISLTTTGTSGAATYNSTTGVLNIPQYSTSVAWGSITGTLSSQTDLQTALNAKQDSLGFTPEDVSNKSTSTSLGTSNTLYPSQNAVKSYVDTAITNLASSGTVQNAYLTNITSDDTTNASEYITWAQGNTGFLAQKVSTALRFNPSTGTLSSTNFSGALSGNATTATTLQTARNINGVSFNGSADITVTAAAGTLTGTTLNSTVVTSSLTSVGTITSGTWNGTAIGDTYISSATNWNTAYTNRITSLTTTGSSGSATLSSNTLNIPTYTLSGLGGVPTTTTVNGHALSSNVTVTADDVLPSQTGNSGKFLTTNGTTASWGTPGGSGTVTSVDLSVPSWLSISGNPITTSGTLAVTAATGQTANQFLATPNGITGAVSLRSIVAADIPTLNQNTTGSAATLTTSRNIYGNAFNGSADVTAVIAGTYGGTGVNNGSKTITVSGNVSIGSTTNTVSFATSGNTSVTLPTTGTLATLAGSETFTNKTLTTPVIASITNTGTLTLPTVTGTLVQYVENSTASSATPSPTGNARDNRYYITALAAAATFASPSGTPANGNSLLIRVKDNGTARALSWNAIYAGGTQIALPSTTTISKTMYIQFLYNSTSSKWELTGVTDGL